MTDNAYTTYLTRADKDRINLIDKITFHAQINPFDTQPYHDALGVIRRLPADCSDELRGAALYEKAHTLIALAEKASLGTDNIRLKSDLYDIRRDLYTMSAPFSFDDFMVAMEWNREPHARFWLPRRRVLEGQHHIASKLHTFMNDDSKKFLSLSQPPGTGKSTIIKFLLTYIALKEPSSLNMYVSYSSGMISLMYNAIVQMLTESEYRAAEIFPGLKELDISGEFSTISYRKKGDFPTVGLVSLGASVTGRTRANRFMVTDDLVKNREEAASPERLNKLWADYTATLTTRTIGDNVKQIMLGTIWSLYDPISRMKSEHEGDPAYEFIAVPVWDERTEKSNFEYECADRYTTESIRVVRENLDPRDFSALYLCRPLEKEGLAFPRDMMYRYNGVLPDTEPDRVLFVTDVAWGGGDSCSAPVAYVYGEDVYIHDWMFDRHSKDITEPRLVGKIIRHKCHTGTIEANNGGEGYADDINRLLKEKNYKCHIKTKRAPSTMAKLSKIEQYQDEIKRFYFLEDHLQDDDYRAAFNELTSFTFTGKNLHDDAADSMAQLADAVSGRMLKPTTFKRPF